MNIFVTGATGYIGKAVVRALHRAGHEVFGLSRSAERGGILRTLGGHKVVGDLKQPDTYVEAAATCEALVHVAMEHGADAPGVDRTAIDTLLAAARRSGTFRTFIYTSGVWVLGPTPGRTADEAAPTTHPAAAVAWRPAHEQLVLEGAGRQIVTAVVRPGIVFGGKGGLIVPSFFETAQRDGAARIVGDGRNRWSPVHLDDVADLYLRVLEMAFANGVASLPPAERIFHAVSGRAEPVEDIARAASLAAGRNAETRSVPVDDARELWGLFADALVMDQSVAATRSERALGWRPRWRGFVRNAAEAFSEWTS